MVDVIPDTVLVVYVIIGFGAAYLVASLAMKAIDWWLKNNDK